MKAKYISTQFNTLMVDFKTLNTIRGYKTGNGYLYPQAVQEFLEWIETIGVYRVEEIVSKHIYDYYEYLTSRDNKRRTGTLSNSSIKHHLFGIRIFFEMVQEMDYQIQISNIPRHKITTQKAKDILDVEDIQELYKRCESKMETALLSLAYGCGLRRAEVNQLDTTDISFSTGFLIVKYGKGGKRREIPMSDFVLESLLDYVRFERVLRMKIANDTTAFLLNKSGGRVSDRGLSRCLDDIVVKCSMKVRSKEPTLHSLRHAIATHLAEQGADVHFIKEFLGHTNIDTSQHYILQRKRNNQIKRKL